MTTSRSKLFSVPLAWRRVRTEMPTEHVVKQGEHLSQIAKQHGFFDFRLIWDHPKNAKLKALRLNPNVLLPGDLLHIPDKEPKKESRPTGARHVFRIPGPTLTLRV